MAGCGFGGSCLPKDVSALIAQGKSMGIPMEVLQASLTVNERQPNEIFRLLAKHFAELKERRITVLGLAFRPDTNDMRESPAIPIIKRLLSEGALVTAFDPAASEEGKGIFGSEIRIVNSLENAIENAEAIVLITRWKDFERLPGLLSKLVPQPLLVDGRRMIGKDSVERYEGIGL
jgi:UDPglucose 6-dehydrogenase/GDP-mannose 6-dehydrogenase